MSFSKWQKLLGTYQSSLLVQISAFLSLAMAFLSEHIFLKNLSQILCSNWPNPENF